MGSRQEAIPAFKKLTFPFGSYKVRYAWVSQRGYYPDDLDKANQDAFDVKECFADSEDMAFFGVFDGHGSTGDFCAQYTRDALVPELEKMFKAHPNDPELAFKKAYTTVNELLHKEVRGTAHRRPRARTPALALLLTGRSQ